LWWIKCIREVIFNNKIFFLWVPGAAAARHGHIPGAWQWELKFCEASTYVTYHFPLTELNRLWLLFLGGAQYGFSPLPSFSSLSNIFHETVDRNFMRFMFLV
jgi:hypothetical protein